LVVLPKKYKKYKLKRKKEPEPEEITTATSKFLGKYAQSQRKRRTPEEKKEYKKLALFLLVWSSFVGSVYYAVVQLENESLMLGVMIAYQVIAVALFLIWLIYNGGFKKIDVEKYEKPDDMGYDEFCNFIDKLKERQRKAKYLLILFIPFIVVLLMDWWIINLTTKK